MSVSHHQIHRLAVAATIAAATVAPGCAGPGGGSRPTASDLPEPVYTPAGNSRTVRVRAEVLPIGAVPYDNFSLPLVSPDGVFIVTQTGVPPSIDTALGRPGAPVPEVTQLEIFRLSHEGKSPERHRVIGNGLLLGRSCDREGFIVEAPQSDGSRWIGFATWETGALRWIVADESVNAFATIGPLGQFAWSRRDPGSDHFDLVVQTGTSEWTVTSQGDDWLMPTWSGKGDDLFVLNLSDGDLDLVHALASSPAALRQSLRRLPLSSGATIYSAYQTLNAQITVAGGPMPRHSRVVFFHPARRRAAVWSPFAVSTVGVVEFDMMAATAVLDDGPFALVCTPKNLVRQSLEISRERINLLAGLLVPRPTPLSEWPYLLVSPGEGMMGLTVMRMLPAENPR